MKLAGRRLRPERGQRLRAEPHLQEHIRSTMDAKNGNTADAAVRDKGIEWISGGSDGEQRNTTLETAAERQI